jgi:polysaccharide pyruvyl transferase CsaB
MMRRVRNVLVLAWVGSTNLGDELVFASLSRKLRARSVHVTVVSRHPAVTQRDHGVDAIGTRDMGALSRSVTSADAVVFGGGGLVQNRTSAFNLPYHLMRPVLSQVRQRPLAGIGLGVGPLRGVIADRLVRAGLRRAHPITVRDEASSRQLQRLGIDAVTTADLAFGLEPPTGTTADRVVVCLRPWSERRHRLPVRVQRPTTADSYVDEAAAALDGIACSAGLPVHFVALQGDRDHPLHEQVADRMRATVSFATPTVHDVLDELARGALVVSMRYHGVVGAALAGRPSVAIGYDPKVEAVANDLGDAVRLVPWSAAGFASLPDAARAVITRMDAAIVGRERMRERDRGNDTAIDELLTR